MLRLYDRLPDSVTVDGKRYKCDFDFRNVIKMLDIMQRDDIYPDARDYLCAKCVCSPPRNAAAVYRELCAVLFPQATQTPETGSKRITSYEQDAGLIRAAFRQVYQIDLHREKLHWLEFTELLCNLPDGCRYMEVIGIRARPMPAPTKYNQKEREWLLRAKQQHALHLTEHEAAQKYESDVGKIFAGLMHIAKTGTEVGNGG